MPPHWRRGAGKRGLESSTLYGSFPVQEETNTNCMAYWLGPLSDEPVQHASATLLVDKMCNSSGLIVAVRLIPPSFPLPHTCLSNISETKVCVLSK